MTREEFYTKYKDVRFHLSSYYKYVFTFKGEYEGNPIFVGVGGNSDAIYREGFSVDSSESLESLQPFEGECGEDFFYDY